MRLEKKCKRQTAVDTRRDTHSRLSYFEMSLFQLAVKYTSRSLVATLVFDTLCALYEDRENVKIITLELLLFRFQFPEECRSIKKVTLECYLCVCA